MKKNIFLLLIVAIAAVFSSCEMMNAPEMGNGVRSLTFGNEFNERPKHDSIVVVTPGETVTKYITDTIYIPGQTDSVYVVTTEHDTIMIPVVHTDTIYQDWVNKYSFGYNPSILRGDIYYDVENETWLDVEKKDEKSHFETTTTLGIRVRKATADTLFLRNMGRNIKYLTPSYENNLTYDDRTFEGGVVSKTERDVRLKMNDSYETVVPQYYEEAFVTDEGVLRQLPSFRITSTEYLSHEDHVIVDDTIVKDGMVYNAIRRDAKIAAHVVVFPQVGEAYEETVILTSDNTMDELKQKIYVEDHPYVEPTPKDTIPEDTVPTTQPDDPGYANFIHIYKTVAVNMAGGLEHAFLGLKDDNTLVAFSLNECQYVNGEYVITDPSEFTVSDDPTAYNSVSYDGDLVPAVLQDVNGSKRWYYEGKPVCAFKDGSLASAQRDQNFDITSIKMQDLSYKVNFKNVGNTTHILMPNYTVVLQHGTTSKAKKRAPMHVNYKGIRANLVY